MNKREDKIKILIEDGRDLYRTQDLAVLWNIENENTLYTTIKRYIKRGLLNKIYKGFYSIKEINKISPVVLGLTGLNRYGYLSTESVLLKNGIIFQDIKYITIVSNISKRFKINNYNFLVRKMKEDYLYNNIGVINKEATLERAVADILYFNPNYHFDAKDIIDFKKVKEIKNKIGY